MTSNPLQDADRRRLGVSRREHLGPHMSILLFAIWIRVRVGLKIVSVETENLLWKLWALQIWPLGTWRGKSYCFPLELLHLIVRGSATTSPRPDRLQTSGADNVTVFWFLNSHLVHVRKFQWLTCEFETSRIFRIQLGLHSNCFSVLFMGQA